MQKLTRTAEELRGQPVENRRKGSLKAASSRQSLPHLNIAYFVLKKILWQKKKKDHDWHLRDRNEQQSEGPALSSYLFAVFYKWLYHIEVLVAATNGTAGTFIPCMPPFKRCLSSCQRLLCRWCWRAGQHECLQCGHFSLKYVNLEKKSAPSHTQHTLWQMWPSISNLVKTLSRTEI